MARTTGELADDLLRFSETWDSLTVPRVNEPEKRHLSVLLRMTRTTDGRIIWELNESKAKTYNLVAQPFFKEGL